MKALNYDSKLIQTFRTLFDYFGMNLMFLLCCIPVITIGSAQVALYTALRACHRNEPWCALYWKTFITSLKQPTVVWVLSAVLMIVFGLNGYNSINLGHRGLGIVSYICLCLVAAVSALAPMFYSRFDCTIKEMVINSMRMLIAFPLRMVIGTALTWAPAAFYMVQMLQWIILKWLFVFVLVYFSGVGAIFQWMMKKPFGLLSGDVQEPEDSYLIREAKKNLEKLEAELIRQNNAKMAKQNAKEEEHEQTPESVETEQSPES